MAVQLSILRTPAGAVVPPTYVDLRNDPRIPRNAANAAKWRRQRIKRVQYGFTHFPAYPAPQATEAAEVAQLAGFAAFHISKDWSSDGSGVYGWGIMYHWAVGPSGNVYALNDWQDILWNTTNGNPYGVAALVLIGEGQEMTGSQAQALLQHWEYQYATQAWAATHATSFGHGECGQIWGGGPSFGNNTNCPSKGVLEEWVKPYRAGQFSGGIVVPPRPVQPPVPVQQYQFFPQTGHTMGHAFLSFFTQHGGVAVFGYPITEEEDGALEGLPGYTVQYTERARFEWCRATGALTLGLLGDLLLKAQGRVPGTAQVDPQFAAFYNGNGGIPILGLPVLPAGQEQIEGTSYLVQYCERARLELHPEGVMLGRVGAEYEAAQMGANRLTFCRMAAA